MQAYIESLIRFNQVQITDVPEPVPVHLWLDHNITSQQAVSYGTGLRTVMPDGWKGNCGPGRKKWQGRTTTTSPVPMLDLWVWKYLLPLFRATKYSSTTTPLRDSHTVLRRHFNTYLLKQAFDCQHFDQERYILPGVVVCLSVCWQLDVKTTDGLFMTILQEMYLCSGSSAKWDLCETVDRCGSYAFLHSQEAL